MLNLSGHSHALLLNYEEEMTTQFGDGQSLALRLRIPLFVGTFSAQGEQALCRLRKTLPKEGFLTDYESGLDEATTRDHRYEFACGQRWNLHPRIPRRSPSSSPTTKT